MLLVAARMLRTVIPTRRLWFCLHNNGICNWFSSPRLDVYFHVIMSTSKREKRTNSTSSTSLFRERGVYEIGRPKCKKKLNKTILCHSQSLSLSTILVHILADSLVHNLSLAVITCLWGYMTSQVGDVFF